MKCSSSTTNVVWRRTVLLKIFLTTLLMTRVQPSMALPKKTKIRMQLGPLMGSDCIFMLFLAFHSFIWIWLCNEYYIPINAYLFPFSYAFLITLLSFFKYNLLVVLLQVGYIPRAEQGYSVQHLQMVSPWVSSLRYNVGFFLICLKFFSSFFNRVLEDPSND